MVNPENVPGKERFVKEKRLREIYGVSTQTVNKWKRLGMPFIPLNPARILGRGSRSRYDLEAVENWLKNTIERALR